MRLLSTFVVCMVLFSIDVQAELSPRSCAILRTANSFTKIIPEIAQLAMRYYRASSTSTSHHRQKRFLFGDNIPRNGSSSTSKATVPEQMLANAVRDVNFTNVAILILNNNETMTKLRNHVDSDAILRIIL